MTGKAQAKIIFFLGRDLTGLGCKGTEEKLDIQRGKRSKFPVGTRSSGRSNVL